jgi:hypothetical protein
MMSKRYIRIPLTPEMITMSAVDIAADSERRIREQLPGATIKWFAELLEPRKGEFEDWLAWAPGEPIPDGTFLLHCIGTGTGVLNGGHDE